MSFFTYEYYALLYCPVHFKIKMSSAFTSFDQNSIWWKFPLKSKTEHSTMMHRVVSSNSKAIEVSRYALDCKLSVQGTSYRWDQSSCRLASCSRSPRSCPSARSGRSRSSSIRTSFWRTQHSSLKCFNNVCSYLARNANAGLFLFIFVFSKWQGSNINWIRRIRCAWDLNLGQQDGRRWQIHLAMAVSLT